MARRGSMRLRVGLALAILAAAVLAQRSSRHDSAPPAAGPRLVLLLVVDQMRYDNLERYGPLFHGGLQRLLTSGVSFTQADHAHANTVTAAGHAVLATGLHPGHNGIVDNYWLDRASGKRVYCVEDERDKVSPRRLIGSTLGDWLKGRGWPSKVYALSEKDRSAVLLGGHEADGAYWYESKTGRFVSSSYYPDRAPAWLAAFNKSGAVEESFGKVWEPLPLDAAVLERLGIEEPGFGALLPGFPHTYGSADVAPDEDFYMDLLVSPFLDEHLVRLSERLVEAEGLGADAYPDLLAISFSSPDAVGHEFGPDSREVLDMLLHLDADLGQLLDFVDAKVGLANTVVALSSDHGVMPVPEVLQRRGQKGKRIGAEEIRCFQQAAREASTRFGRARWLEPGLYLDREAIERSGRALPEIQRQLAALLERCPSVARVYTASELESGTPPDAPLGELFVNSHHPQRSPDLEVQFEEYFLASRSYAASHGTPYRYDTHVPMLLMAPGLASGRIDRPVRTVDLAPTLGVLAGVQPPQGLDGVDLGVWLRERSEGGARTADGPVAPQR
jgi:arylsulfatase A-like enzyme